MDDNIDTLLEFVNGETVETSHLNQFNAAEIRISHHATFRHDVLDAFKHSISSDCCFNILREKRFTRSQFEQKRIERARYKILYMPRAFYNLEQWDALNTFLRNPSLETFANYLEIIVNTPIQPSIASSDKIRTQSFRPKIRTESRMPRRSKRLAEKNRGRAAMKH